MSMGDYFVSGQVNPAPRAVDDGIFAGPLSGGHHLSASPNGHMPVARQPPPMPQAAGEYWQGGGMPEASATDEGIFNGAVRGMGGGAVGLGLSPGGAAAGAITLWLVVGGLGGFVAGRAMAPDEGSKTGYSLAGAVAGALLGAVGLGIVGGVALATKR